MMTTQAAEETEGTTSSLDLADQIAALVDGAPAVPEAVMNAIEEATSSPELVLVTALPPALPTVAVNGDFYPGSARKPVAAVIEEPSEPEFVPAPAPVPADSCNMHTPPASTGVAPNLSAAGPSSSTSSAAPSSSAARPDRRRPALRATRSLESSLHGDGDNARAGGGGSGGQPDVPPAEEKLDELSQLVETAAKEREQLLWTTLRKMVRIILGKRYVNQTSEAKVQTDICRLGCLGNEISKAPENKQTSYFSALKSHKKQICIYI